MNPPLIVAAGLAALVAAAVVLRSFGTRYRVGRLLATTPRVTVEEAATIARSGRRRYVRVDGRIDADGEFEDSEHRPLVFRRTRLEARGSRGWNVFEDGREQVPFEIREGLHGIAVDAAALDHGLVVVPRLSTGSAADLAGRAPDGLPPATPVRARIEQVSSVEHAVVLGVPALDDADRARLTAGMGRPLVLTTLEPPEAMRILAGGTGRPRLAAGLLGLGLTLVLAGLGWWLVEAIA